jgi:hypothetical protein
MCPRPVQMFVGITICVPEAVGPRSLPRVVTARALGDECEMGADSGIKSTARSAD